MALTDNLVGYWNMDQSGTRTDSLGLNDLSQTGTISQVAGKISNAASNSGSTSNYLEKNGLTSWISGTSDRTFAFWIRTGSATDQTAITNTQGSPGTRAFVEYVVASSGLFSVEIAWVNGGNQGAGGPTTFDVDDNNWHFVCSRIFNDGVGKVDVSVDNAAFQTFQHASQTFDFGSLPRLRVGTSFNWSSGAAQMPLNGAIDEVGIWSRKLSDAECTQLYNAGAGLTYPFATGPSGIASRSGASASAISTFDGTAWASIDSISGVT
jgi:hypothetical protein